MDNYLIHYGIKGQKWGVRRYQNDDGSLTDAGRRRYGGGAGKIEAFYTAKKNRINAKIESTKESGDLAKLEKLRNKRNSIQKNESLNKRTANINALHKQTKLKGRTGLDYFEDKSKNPFLNAARGRKINASYETRNERGRWLREQGRTKPGAIGRFIGRDILAGVVGGIAVSAISLSPLTDRGMAAGSTIIRGAAAAYTISSIIRTYQDFSDMRTYDDTRYRGKKR